MPDKKKKKKDEDVDVEDSGKSKKGEASPDDIKVTKKEMRIYRNWIKMSRKRREVLFEPTAKRVRSLWKEGKRPEWAKDSVSVDMVFANTEIIKPNVFFKNPRIFVRPKQQTFIMEDGRTLDGMKAASLLEDAANYVGYSTRLKRTVKQVRDDALILTYGVIFLGYEGMVGINEEGNPYIEEDSIYHLRLSPFNFLVDPEAKDCFTYTDARWVGREYIISLEDLKDDPWYENTEDVKTELVGYGDKVNLSADKGSEKVGNLIDVTEKEFKSSNEVKRIRLVELWIKPSTKERIKNPKARGRVVVLTESADEPYKAIKWPYKIKHFPFRGLAFYKDNDEFYPISDVTHYEQQIEEIDKIRTAQLEWVQKFGQRKILLNVDAFDSAEEITKLESPEAGPFIKVHLGAGGDLNKVAMAMQFGSAPNEMFVVDKKVMEDADRISGVSDIRRGMPPPGLETATEGKLIYNSGSYRFIEKKDEISDFYGDVARIIIQFIKQFWTVDTMVRRLGTLAPEWTDNFSAKDVQIEDDVEIDIGEMVPMDESVRKRIALQTLELASKGVTVGAIKQKLAEEGYEIQISEVIKETMLSLDMKNDKILTRIDPDKYVRVLQELLKNKLTGAGGPAGGGGGGGRTIRDGAPSPGAELSGAKRELKIPSDSGI